MREGSWRESLKFIQIFSLISPPTWGDEKYKEENFEAVKVKKDFFFSFSLPLTFFSSDLNRWQGFSHTNSSPSWIRVEEDFRVRYSKLAEGGCLLVIRKETSIYNWWQKRHLTGKARKIFVYPDRTFYNSWALKPVDRGFWTT